MASADLFHNGNALFFDDAGEQILEFQKRGLCGLHGFVERYPAAPVYWSFWRESRHLIQPELIPWLLRHLRKAPGPRPE